MKWKLVCCAVFLAWIMAQAAPLIAATGTTEVTGTVPLVTYEVSASKITSHGTTISWKTNGKATSQVFYDTKFHQHIGDYRHCTREKTALVSQHHLRLVRLFVFTTYHYRVKSVAIIDGSEFIAVSEDCSFITKGTTRGRWWWRWW